MAIMIPSVISPEVKSSAERKIFEWFQNAPGTDKWIVLHSLGITTHNKVIYGETDFLVLAPQLGIFALEVKGGRVKRENGTSQIDTVKLTAKFVARLSRQKMESSAL